MERKTELGAGGVGCALLSSEGKVARILLVHYLMMNTAGGMRASLRKSRHSSSIIYLLRAF